MPQKKGHQATALCGGDVEKRFTELLSIMKARYLAAGYELDDIHLAKILGVHEGILRKGKRESVSQTLSDAVGRIWKVDLNWLRLGEGEKPQASGPPFGIERLPLKVRVKHGRWDENKVRSLLKKRNISQKKLAELLNTGYQRAGDLVRGSSRVVELRIRLAEILEINPDSLFLVPEIPARKTGAARRKLPGKSAGSGQPLFSLAAIHRAVESTLEEHLEQALAQQAAALEAAEFESTEVSIFIPPPPADLSESERKRYEHNREVLERWSRTQGAFQASPSAVERYCREVVGFYDGGRVDDVGGILRDFMQEDLERSDTRRSADEERIKLKKGILLIGDTEIEVDDPVLLAKLPEFLSSKAGRKRLLDWLRKNVAKAK
ncbi:MAG TPA: helix-turn-helix transcriptional regulator [archaeon]|nr:helix-turn-helix transcriptional regulator [archaeon]